MHEEIHHASHFLSRYISTRFPSTVADRFAHTLSGVLASRYTGHWYPNAPLRGSAYRCLTNFHHIPDPAILRAGQEVKREMEQDDPKGAMEWRVEDLLDCFPGELVVWVDPYSVTYRVSDRTAPTPIFERRTALEFERRLAGRGITISAPPSSTPVHAHAPSDVMSPRPPTAPLKSRSIPQDLVGVPPAALGVWAPGDMGGQQVEVRGMGMDPGPSPWDDEWVAR
ncbi:BTG-domain-containing protein [Gonapodya prolifera JEL478]|uniref:BTG-domain-containing protein n=1 Tax=Gonapodya prolifera (strain JEL478) TaxID=1344416 RepID=A0A139ACI4_GONPJ|nr:BTG-domain-containing protein [Gonapodya prolifera JEL478]|eukprot:KXS14458.1 BTG-domain-containing protein [Gonapodya prolifera JEL478]